jgi:LacI family transcriptional regulator
MSNERNPPKKKRRVTIKDVARASGVSCATVSRVLSGYEFVRETTRNRVMEAVEHLGYVANLQARSLVSGRSQIIGLLVPNLDNSYVGTITQGIDQELARANYDVMLYTSHRHPGKESFYVSAIANGLTEGLLLIAPLVPTTYLDALREQNFPYVLIDQADATENSSVVEATNWHGAYEATRYLSQLGHTRIAFVTGSLAVRRPTPRLQSSPGRLRHSRQGRIDHRRRLPAANRSRDHQKSVAERRSSTNGHFCIQRSVSFGRDGRGTRMWPPYS